MSNTTDAPITHPEEMRFSGTVRLNDKTTLQGDVRLTPAGIVTAGLMAIGILLATTALVRAARR